MLASQASRMGKSGACASREASMAKVLARGAIGSVCMILAFAVASSARGETDTAVFLEACTADPVVKDEPGLSEDSQVTPKVYCECVAGKLKEASLPQTDVDMLVKMHKDEITDEDAETFANLDVLMQTNEKLEDECKASLGMPTGDNGEEEEGAPLGEEDVPVEE
jgi:hypothetical protein